MPMPPALAAALAAKNGSGKKKKAAFGGKKPGNAAEDMLDGGKDDASETSGPALAMAAKVKLAAPKGKKKGAIPPQFLK